jgi:hypothetical protein
MNYIRRIQAERTELETKIAKTDDSISDVIAFLHSAKFTGVESDGGRKDWIATGDMITILQNLRSELR